MDLQQSQVLSHRMIQSAEILQMSSQELEHYINEAALENPVMEFTERLSSLDVTEDKIKKYEWLNSLDDDNRYTYYSQDRDEESDKREMWNYNLDEGETLSDYLWSQIISVDYSKSETDVIKYMLECLDARGYMEESYKDISKIFNISEEKVESLHNDLKKLEPAGICASNLKDCLILQLIRVKCDSAIMRTIINDYLDLLAKNQIPAIAKRLKCPLEDAVKYCSIIKKLNPKPGSCFCSREQLKYIVPDVTIVKFKEYYEILLNEHLYPSIEVNSYYKQLSKEQDSEDVKDYLQSKIKQTEWIKNCVAQRNITLMNVTKAILKFQEDFFSNGNHHLKTLRLQDVARMLDIHESTVSRAVRKKYLQCSWGIYPMNYFFSKGISMPEESKSISTLQIKQALVDLIENENKLKPYSDRILSEKLEDQGIHISRRTVAKYREEMGIYDTSGRKHY